MKRLLLLVTICCVLLWGCGMRHGQKEKSGAKVVMRITMTMAESDSQPLRTYEQEESIEKVLEYLNQFELGEEALETESLSNGACEIALYYADGSSKCYYLKNNCFLKEGNGPWYELEETPEITLREFIFINRDDLLQEVETSGEDTTDVPDRVHRIP